MKSNSEYYTLNLESMPKSLGCQSMLLLEDDGTFKMWNLVGGNKIFGRSAFGRNTGVLNNSSCSVCILVAIKGSFLSHMFKTWYPIIRSPRQQSQMTIKQKNLNTGAKVHLSFIYQIDYLIQNISMQFFPVKKNKANFILG